MVQGYIAIPKSSRKDRIISNAKVFDFSLTDDEILDLDRLDEGEFVSTLASLKSYLWDRTGNRLGSYRLPVEKSCCLALVICEVWGSKHCFIVVTFT